MQLTHLGKLPVCGRMSDYQPVVTWLGSWVPGRTCRLIFDRCIFVDKHSDATFQYDVQTEKNTTRHYSYILSLPRGLFYLHDNVSDHSITVRLLCWTQYSRVVSSITALGTVGHCREDTCECDGLVHIVRTRRISIYCSLSCCTTKTIYIVHISLQCFLRQTVWSDFTYLYLMQGARAAGSWDKNKHMAA